jgi:hypothetical protein
VDKMEPHRDLIGDVENARGGTRFDFDIGQHDRTQEELPCLRAMDMFR